MDKYISVVFNSDEQANEALHALWKLDKAGEITLHGATVVHRDSLGHIDVSTKKTNVGARTAIGVGIGAILGALAGPIGSAVGAGAALAAAGGAGAFDRHWRCDGWTCRHHRSWDQGERTR